MPQISSSGALFYDMRQAVPERLQDLENLPA
jgi:hypothetical protein